MEKFRRSLTACICQLAAISGHRENTQNTAIDNCSVKKPSVSEDKNLIRYLYFERLLGVILLPGIIMDTT